jgi:hypothetical protein
MGFWKSLFGRFFGPPSRDRFARIVADALRRAGELHPYTYDKAGYRLVYTENGKEVRVVNLANLYLEYCAAPRSERDLWLRQTCAAMAHPMELPEDFEDVKPDLLPTVRPRSLVEHMRLKAMAGGAEEPAEMAWLPLTEHLVVCFVYDLPRSMRFIMADEVEKWGVTPYEALEIARQNLDERECVVLGIGDKLYIFESGDSYDGSRLLLTDKIRRLKVSGQPVAIAVSRNTLLVTGSDDVEGLGIMARLTEQKMTEARPLCPIPVVLAGDEWETWFPPPGHPHLAKLRQFELQYLAGEYAEQKEELEKLNEQTGADVFVASFMGVEKDGRQRSWSTWSKGVPTWLPRTDYVALYDPDTKAPRLVPWERVEETVGHLMTEQDCYPPRWLVTDFPSPDQIEQMAAEDPSR